MEAGTGLDLYFPQRLKITFDIQSATLHALFVGHFDDESFSTIGCTSTDIQTLNYQEITSSGGASYGLRGSSGSANLERLHDAPKTA